jgi:TATA-box binding protein (TBP) (component of TFIID and TFIIIB)
MDIDAAWEEYLENGNINDNISTKMENKIEDVPKASELYISTKTKIVYLNQPINLNEIFWNINIINFDNHIEGIIKKQIKLISTNQEELENINKKLQQYDFYTEYIITHIDKTQSDSSIYKDVRKISIGISQKDILSYRCKQKSAFYNCFVMILRLYDDNNNTFKEMHIKIFNTGKIEIPGVQDDEIFEKTCKYILKILNNISNENKYYIHDDKTEIILINSNFHCGFCINRQKLFDIMRRNYNLNASYDPCSYPGIQCKYKINSNNISFMIFRTGSILIVGKCEDDIIRQTYEFIKKMLYTEFNNIKENYHQPIIKSKDKPAKQRKKIIFI